MNILDVEEERGLSAVVAVVASTNPLKANIEINDRERIKSNEYPYLQSAPTSLRDTKYQ